MGHDALVTDRFTAVTRLLIGGCTIDDAASDLRVSTNEVAELLQTVAPGEADLAPVGLNLETRQVEFADLQGATFREPFLSETLQKIRDHDTELLNFEVSFEAFFGAGDRLTAEPRGFIFHVG